MASTTGGRSVSADAPSGRRYTEVAQHLHWITPPLLAAQLAIAWVMISMAPTNPLGGQLFSLHKSLGVTIWLLVALRLTWRLTHPAPKPGPHMPRWMHLAGEANHWMMYLVLFVTPISGYVMSAMGPHGVQVWGLPLPSLPKLPAIQKAAQIGHYLESWAIYALVLLHGAATAWHVVVRRDGLLQRMIPAQVHADPDLPM